MIERIRLTPSTTLLNAWQTKLGEFGHSDDDGAFTAWPVTANFTPTPSLAMADVTRDTAHFQSFPSESLVPYRDPVTSEYVQAINVLYPPNRWIICSSLSTPLTVYGFVYGNALATELYLSSKLATPITFNASGQYAEVPEFAVRWGPDVFNSTAP